MELHHELFHYFFSGPCFPIIIYEDDRYLSSSLMEIVTSRTISFFLQRSLFSHHHFWRRPVPVVIADGVCYVTNCFIISSEVPVFPSSLLKATGMSSSLMEFVTSRTVSLFFQRSLFFDHHFWGRPLLIVIADGDRYVTNDFVLSSEVPVFPSSLLKATGTCRHRWWSLLCHELFHYFFRGPCFPIIISEDDRYLSSCPMEFVTSPTVVLFLHWGVWWRLLRHELFVMCSEVPVFPSSFPRAIATSPACPPGAWCWSGPTRSWMTPV